MLPDISGYEIAKEIRKNSNVPIIMLSAKSEEEDKLKGFEMGAIDYVTKPFSPKELMARIKVNLLKENVQKIQKETNNLTLMINDMLDLSKLEN